MENLNYHTAITMLKEAGYTVDEYNDSVEAVLNDSFIEFNKGYFDQIINVEHTYRDMGTFTVESLEVLIEANKVHLTYGYFVCQDGYIWQIKENGETNYPHSFNVKKGTVYPNKLVHCAFLLKENVDGLLINYG